jgi:cytochrome c oxidase subunit 4
MAEAHPDTTHQDAGHGPTYQLYMVIAVALTIFTAVSFFVNMAVHYEVLTAFNGFVVILLVAVVKASLVGLFFMHLKYDWGKLYFLIIPAFILGTMMMIVFLPDMVFAWQPMP